MDTQPGTSGEPGTRKRVGRTGADGVEKQISLKPIKDGIAECVKLYRKSETAKENYQKELKEVAERGGVQASNLNKLIKASLRGKFKDVQRDIEQQQLLFDEVGEAAGGPGAGDKSTGE